MLIWPKKEEDYKEKNIKHFSPYTGKEIIQFGDIEVHQHKSPISINYVGISKIVVSYGALFGKKEF